MKLGTVELHTALGRFRRAAALTDAGVVDLTAARIACLEQHYERETASRVGQAQLPPDLILIIRGGASSLAWAREALDFALLDPRARTLSGAKLVHALQDVRVLAPIPRPSGIACFTTWKEHVQAAEARGSAVRWIDEGSEMRPYYKGNPESVIGSGTPLELPSYGDELDMECEFAAIVGTGGRDLTVEQARAAIVGYCIYNDVSIRSIQRREMQKGLGPAKGKDHDGGNVLGPWLVTPDEVGDVHNLIMSLHVNGEELSHYSTSRMAWDHAELLAYLSRGQTIQPGHVLTSGSYPGGCGSDLGRTFKPGDRIEMRISQLGALSNVIVAQDPSSRRLIA